jgi:chorismate mutase
MSDDLQQLREQINQIDDQLVQLISTRAEIALGLGKLKAKDGHDIYDPARERIILDRVDRLNQGPLDKGALEDVFACIITACREIQIH